VTEQDATKIVILLVATFPTPSWEKQTMQVCREMLVDLDAAATTQVVRDWIKTHDERPTIAAIRREVGKLQAAASGASFLPADEAWSYVMRCFGSVGQYREFPAEHPLVKKAVDGIGWPEMCRSDNIEVLRGQFRMAYTALLERSITEVAASEGAAMLPAPVRALLGAVH
jgi:hypothetical protein